MALDDASTALLTQLAESGAKPLHEMTPTEARGFAALLGDMFGTGPDVAAVHDETVPGPGGPVPVRILVPPGVPRAVIVHYHGGGWVIGSIAESDALGRGLAVATGAVVVLVDYRLAPEHRHPAAVDDSWAALLWVDQHLVELAGARVPLLVMGDSAGGNLAAVVAQRAQAEGGPAIAMQVLVYPVTDDDLDTPSYTDPANQLILSRDAMVWFWDHYVPEHSDRRRPDAAPMRAEDLAGQPPAIVLTAEHDPLRDEGEAYARKLREAGVPVEHRRFDGQMHGFFTMVGVLPGAAAGMAYVAEQIEKGIG